MPACVVSGTLPLEYAFISKRGRGGRWRELRALEYEGMALALAECRVSRRPDVVEQKREKESREAVPSSINYVANQESLQEIADSP